MESDSGQERLHAWVTGRVQGVGFRAFVLTKASQLGLAGWCRNVGWNQVEVLAEGNHAALAGLLDELRHGPDMAMVEKLEPEWSQATGEFSQFRVR